MYDAIMNRFIAASFVMFALSACSGTAQLVRRDVEHGTTAGGRIELHGAYMTAMADAQVLMTERCGGRYIWWHPMNAQLDEHKETVEFQCIEFMHTLDGR